MNDVGRSDEGGEGIGLIEFGLKIAIADRPRNLPSFRRGVMNFDMHVRDMTWDTFPVFPDRRLRTRS